MADQGERHSGESEGMSHRIGTRTHVGLWRERNEDYLQVSHTRHGLLVIVCDGMGGHVGGERASRLAVETFVKIVEEGDGDPKTLLREGVDRANRAVILESQTNREVAGMGTTLVAALLRDGDAMVANVGDSRAYLLKGGKLSRVSSDHSVVNEMVQRGEITEEEAATHPHRNIITRALGSDQRIEPDIFDVKLDPGDELLLASDGLHGMISDATIRDVLVSTSDPAAACDKLVDRALNAGGRDNVSVALVRIGEGAGHVDSPTTDPGMTRKNKGSSGSFLRSVLLCGALLIGVFVVWALWFQDPPQEQTVTVTDTLRVYGESGYVEDPFLGDPPVPDSGTIDTLAPRDSMKQGIKDTIRPGEAITW